LIAWNMRLLLVISIFGQIDSTESVEQCLYLVAKRTKKHDDHSY
jgi:hypothetical protein